MKWKYRSAYCSVFLFLHSCCSEDVESNYPRGWRKSSGGAALGGNFYNIPNVEDLGIQHEKDDFPMDESGVRQFPYF
jgi:hypothetical protein